MAFEDWGDPESIVALILAKGGILGAITYLAYTLYLRFKEDKEKGKTTKEVLPDIIKEVADAVNKAHECHEHDPKAKPDKVETGKRKTKGGHKPGNK